MIRLALRNIVRSWGHYLPVTAFFAIGWALILIVQGALKGADLNLQAVYPGSLTGDLVVRTDRKPGWTLFGSEESLWSDSSLPPILDHYQEVRALLSTNSAVSDQAGVMAGPVIIDQEGVHHRAWVFGVDPRDYWKVVSGLGLSDKAAAGSAAWLSRALARELKTPGSVRLLYSAGQDFRIVQAPVSGVLDYRIPVTAVEQLMVLDADSARHLFGGRPAAAVADPRNADMTGSDLDRLFFDSSDVEVDGGLDPLTLLDRPVEDAQNAEQDGEVWNFQVLSLKQGADAGAVARSLNRQFAERHWDLEAVGWRTAAGGSALYVQWLQGLLVAGLGLLILVGAGSLVNAMTGIVVERSQEIGTMRALGASRRRIIGLFGVEALTVAGVSVALALVFALAAYGALEWVRIPNAVLGLLFGSRGIRVVFDPVVLAVEVLTLAGLSLAGTWAPLQGILRQGIAVTLEERPS